MREDDEGDAPTFEPLPRPPKHRRGIRNSRLSGAATGRSRAAVARSIKASRRVDPNQVRRPKTPPPTRAEANRMLGLPLNATAHDRNRVRAVRKLAEGMGPEGEALVAQVVDAIKSRLRSEDPRSR